MSGLLTVQNMEGNRTMFVTKEKETVTWERSGDPMGEDIQQVSDEIAQDRDFIKACARGVLRVVPDDDGDSEAQERLAAQIAKYATSRQDSQAEILGRMDRPQDRSISSYECIAPLGRNQTCAQAVMMRLNDAKEIPPLCSRHKALQSNFVASDEGSVGDASSSPTTKWNYMGLS